MSILKRSSYALLGHVSVLAFLICGAGVSPASAGISYSGDVSPTPGSNSWNATNITIGNGSSDYTRVWIEDGATLNATSVLAIQQSVPNKYVMVDVRNNSQVRASVLRLGPTVHSGTALNTSLSFYTNSRLYTDTAYVNGNLSLKGSQWNNTGDVFVSGATSATSVYPVNYNIDNSVVYIGGDMHLYDAVSLVAFGNNTHLTVSNGLFLDGESSGVHISSNATLNTQTATIGSSILNQSNSSVSISGGVWNNAGAMVIGRGSPIYFAIENNGRVNSGGAVVVSENSGGVVTTSMAKGGYLSAPDLTIGDQGMVNWTMRDSELDLSGALNIGLNSDALHRLPQYSGLSVNMEARGDSRIRANNLSVAEGSGSAVRLQFKDTTIADFLTADFSQNGGESFVTLSERSAVNVSGNTVLGGQGTATLQLVDRAKFSTDTLDIATQAGSSGTLLIGRQAGNSDYLSYSGAPGQFSARSVNFGAGQGEIILNHYQTAQTVNGSKDADTAYAFNTDVTGSGVISQLGGDSVLNGDYTGFLGRVNVLGGTLFVGQNTAFSNNTDVTIKNRAVLDFDGMSAVLGDVNNDGGHITLGDGYGALIQVDNYHASGMASMALHSTFQNGVGLSDRLDVLGDTSGTTYLRIRSVDGHEARGVDGVEVIRVAGNSAGDFILMGDYVLEDGQQAISSGGYSYSLHKGSEIAKVLTEKNWYLRLNKNTFQPATSVYEAYPQSLMTLNSVPTLYERQGSKDFIRKVDEKYGLWTLLEGGQVKFASQISVTDTEYKQNAARMNVGIDVPVIKGEEGDLVLGGSLHYFAGRTKTSSSGYYGDGRINTDGYGISPTITWYGDNGFYLDGAAYLSWFSSDLKSASFQDDLVNDNKGFGYSLSGEMGQRFDMNKNYAVSLQTQMVYSGIDFDDFADNLQSTRVSKDNAESLRGRIGATLEYTDRNEGALSSYYAGVKVTHEFLDAPTVTVTDMNGDFPVKFYGAGARTWGGLSVGGTHMWDGSKYGIYAEASGSTPFDGFGDSYVLRGNVGLKIRF